jgi:integrase
MKKRTRKPKRSHRVTYGKGTFYYREKDHRWVGAFLAGQTLSGKPRRIVVTDKKEDEAWKKFEAAQEEWIKHGPLADGLQPGQTVAGWAEKWLEIRETKVRPKTQAQDRTNVNRWIIPAIGRKRLEKLTAEHMRLVGEAPITAGLSLSTANSAQRTLHKLLRDAVAEGYRIPEMIFAADKEGRGTSKRTRMSKDEVSKVFAKAYEIYPDAVRFFLAVLYGARQSEILGLTWDRVILYGDSQKNSTVVGEIRLTYQVQQLPKDPSSGKYVHRRDDDVRQLVDAWHLVPTKTKAGTRSVPLISAVADELVAWKLRCEREHYANPYNLVFPRINGQERYLGYPRNPKQDLAEWKAVQKEAGVCKSDGSHYLLHEARHSMISMLADAGTPRHIIEMLVGQVELVDTYVHGELETAARAVTDVLAPLLPEAAR